MRTLYFDCFAGASGNMILAAIVALGVEKQELIGHLKKLDIVDFDIECTIQDKSGISAVHVEVKVPHEHAHRHLHQIEKIINDSQLSESVKSRAAKIFRTLAEAEAKIHGIDIERVHFHEVGAMDAIIDVVGACVGFELLGVERFVCSKIHVGSGFAKMAHGTFPVPPPAVAELLKNIPIYSTEIEGELITPTGAAIIATMCEEYGKIPEMKVSQTAYGAGTRDYKDFPNVLRLMIGETVNTAQPSDDFNGDDRRRPLEESLILIETNIDDLPPQILGYVMERAFDLGALDCWFTPIQMKKNRPAVMISILCGVDRKDELIRLLYSETTTLGVRLANLQRTYMQREIVKIETEYGDVNVKVAKLNGKIINVKPEYDQLRELALRTAVPLRELEDKVVEYYKQASVA